MERELYSKYINDYHMHHCARRRTYKRGEFKEKWRNDEMIEKVIKHNDELLLKEHKAKKKVLFMLNYFLKTLRVTNDKKTHINPQNLFIRTEEKYHIIIGGRKKYIPEDCVIIKDFRISLIVGTIEMNYESNIRRHCCKNYYISK